MRAAIVDLDGTVYCSTKPISGAAEGINLLRSAGLDVVFVSNTSSKSREICHNRLADIGIDTTLSEIVTSASVTADYVAKTYPNATVMVVGEDSLRDELFQAGVPAIDDPDVADVLVVGKNYSFDFQTLTAAVRALDSGAAFIVTNRDQQTPIADGIVPGTGAIVAAITAAADQEPDIVVGKPHDPIIEATLNRVGCPASDALVIGDNIDTDVAMGENAGMTTALIKSGLSSDGIIEMDGTGPDYVLETLASVNKIFSSEEVA